MKKITLCSKESGCCPEVVIHDDRVEIGEAGNLCTLKPEEWETLKAKILTKEV